MNTVLDKFLCDRFPNLYADRHAPMNTTAMCWGFSCGDGWFPLLFDLSEKIESSLKRMDEERGLKMFPQGTQVTKHPKEPAVNTFRVIQVKEKFGTLRYYTNYITDEISETIREAEKRSAVTCQECGEPGVLRGTNWFRTTCEKHAEGALPVGCTASKQKCSQGTIGCAVDHAAEAAADATQEAADEAEEKKRNLLRQLEAKGELLRRPTSKELDPESIV